MWCVSAIQDLKGILKGGSDNMSQALLVVIAGMLAITGLSGQLVDVVSSADGIVTVEMDGQFYQYYGDTDVAQVFIVVAGNGAIIDAYDIG